MNILCPEKSFMRGNSEFARRVTSFPVDNFFSTFGPRYSMLLYNYYIKFHLLPVFIVCSSRIEMTGFLIYYVIKLKKSFSAMVGYTRAYIA